MESIVVHVIAIVIRHLNIHKYNEYLDIHNSQRLIGNLVLEFDDEILNTNKASIDDKRENNCLIHAISLVIICLLLLVVTCFSCYFPQETG